MFGNGAYRNIFLVFAVVIFTFCAVSWAQPDDLFRKPSKATTGWSSFENLNAVKGQGAMENRGAKGHAFDSLEAGESKVLLDVKGSGMITRMWFTLNSRNAVMLRSIKLEMFWDGADTPAVSVPFGDFFGAILGRPVAFESALFSNPEGRSFNCYVPMPFRKSAKVVVTNESENRLRLLFFDIDYVLGIKHKKDVMYFHSCWRRENPTKLTRDFEILPKITGKGKFLGTNIGVIENKDNIGWWGEGEVKMYIDGDTDFPTIVGTGTEDYIGTGWGQKPFSNLYQGALIEDSSNGHHTFYRYHVPDPVYFNKDIRVTIQQIGGSGKQDIIKMVKSGVPIVPVSVSYSTGFAKLLEEEQPVDIETHDSPAGGWTNYYRRDDVCAVAYFYLDKPENGLPPIADVKDRTDKMDF